MKSHPEVSQKQQGLIFVVLMAITLIWLSLVFNESNFAQEPQTTPDLGESLLLVKNEVNAPILLSIAAAATRALDDSKYQVIVTNISKKPIYAYALRHTVVAERPKSSGMSVSSSASITSLLKPGQWALEYIGDGEYLSRAGATVTVLLDLVMFDDGTTWGPDTKKLAQQLAGRRAGIGTASRQLQELNKERGYAAVQATFDVDISYFAPPPDKTPEWLDGFKSGVGFVRQAIRRAYERGGEAEVELEIQRRIEGKRR